jgi:hypothetical protein
MVVLCAASLALCAAIVLGGATALSDPLPTVEGRVVLTGVLGCVLALMLPRREGR